MAPKKAQRKRLFNQRRKRLPGPFILYYLDFLNKNYAVGKPPSLKGVDVICVAINAGCCWWKLKEKVREDYRQKYRAMKRKRAPKSDRKPRRVRGGRIKKSK